MPIHLIITILAFTGIWLGSGLAVSSVEKLSRTLKISSFAVSFVVLGFFTSMSEFSVGVNAIFANDPEIFVGNLLGASIVLVLLIIPLLGIFGRSIKINPEFRGYNLPAALVTIGLPPILVIDGNLNQLDAFLCVLSFLVMVFGIQTKRSLIEKITGYNSRFKLSIGKELFKILLGVVAIFISSRYLVTQTLYFSEIYQVSPFIISLLGISLGTNLPELSIILRSVISGKSQIAFGDYLGSAAFNTFLMGVLTHAYGQSIALVNSYLISLIFLIVGLIIFYIFARSKNTITILESIVLLSFYFLFIFTEINIH